MRQVTTALARKVSHAPPLRRAMSEALAWRANRQWRAPDAEILVIRHPRYQALNKGLLRWLELNFREARRHFDLRLMPAMGLPVGVNAAGFNLFRYRLALMWLQDPIVAWSPRVNRQALSLEQRLRDAGLPVMNPPATLPNAEKAATAALASGLGIRTSQTRLLRTPADLTAFQRMIGGPVLVRSDWSHGGKIYRLKPDDKLAWSEIERLQQPIAVEYIDTADADGVFWKYRYLAAGEYGISVHCIASPHWEVRGSNKLTDSVRLDRERSFISTTNPHHAKLQQVRRALGLDTVALDYSIDRSGDLVLWEANPCPGLWFGSKAPELRYREQAIHRSYAALAGVYLECAGLPLPELMQELRVYGQDSPGMLSRLQRD